VSGLSVRARLAIFPLLLAAGGCFATRDDVRVLQSDVRTMHEQSLRSDSLNRQMLEQLSQRLAIVDDSLRTLSTRLTRLQGSTREDLYNIGQLLIQIQELTGQSQARLLDLRSELEQRNRAEPPMPDSGTPPSGSTPGDPPPAAAPGPAQLLQLSIDQLRRGSAGTARRGLEEMLRLYPTSDLVPQATFYLGEAHAAEGNLDTADSVFVQVYTRFPRSNEAPTAMYKHGVYLEDQGRSQEAERVFRDVVEQYPRSDAATLARSRLPSN
jgi:tol-pal system protein YbgF